MNDIESVLVFCPTKLLTQSTALKIAQDLKKFYKTQSPAKATTKKTTTTTTTAKSSTTTTTTIMKIPFENERRTLYKELLLTRRDAQDKEKRDLEEMIMMGVGYHHSVLTGPERTLIEEAFHQKVLICLCATSTLAAGVNLPAKRVIIDGPMVGKNLLTRKQYLQMAGRAGRAGKINNSNNKHQNFGDSILILNDKNKDYGISIVLSKEMEPIISPYLHQAGTPDDENTNNSLQIYINMINHSNHNNNNNNVKGKEGDKEISFRRVILEAICIVHKYKILIINGGQTHKKQLQQQGVTIIDILEYLKHSLFYQQQKYVNYNHSNNHKNVNSNNVNNNSNDGWECHLGDKIKTCLQFLLKYNMIEILKTKKNENNKQTKQQQPQQQKQKEEAKERAKQDQQNGNKLNHSDSTSSNDVTNKHKVSNNNTKNTPHQNNKTNNIVNTKIETKTNNNKINNDLNKSKKRPQQQKEVKQQSKKQAKKEEKEEEEEKEQEEIEEYKYKPTLIGTAGYNHNFTPEQLYILLPDLLSCLNTATLSPIDPLHISYLLTPLPPPLPSPPPSLLSNYYSSIPTIRQQLSNALLGINSGLLVSTIITPPPPPILFKLYRWYNASLFASYINEEPPFSIPSSTNSTTSPLSGSTIEIWGVMGASVEGLCEDVGWYALAKAVKGWRDRIVYGVKGELVELMKIEGMKREKARWLFNCEGVRNLADYIAYKKYLKLHHLSSLSSSKLNNNSDDGSMIIDNVNHFALNRSEGSRKEEEHNTNKDDIDNDNDNDKDDGDEDQLWNGVKKEAEREYWAAVREMEEKKAIVDELLF